MTRKGAVGMSRSLWKR